MAATQKTLTVKLTPVGSQNPDTIDFIDFLLAFVKGDIDPINGIVTIAEKQYSLSSLQYWQDDVPQ